MRWLALVLLVVLAAIVVWGITDVLRHDGVWADVIVTVLVPTAGICGCLWLLVGGPGARRQSAPRS